MTPRMTAQRRLYSTVQGNRNRLALRTKGAIMLDFQQSGSMFGIYVLDIPCPEVFAAGNEIGFIMLEFTSFCLL
jgi:hypothetical protein